MKKQKMQLFVMLGLLLLCLLAYILLMQHGKKIQAAEEETAAGESAKETVCQLDADSITAFSYQLDGTTYSYTKNGETWTYDGDVSMDLDEDKITSLLTAVTMVTCDDRIDDTEDLAQFGLDQPSNVITVHTDEKDTVISIGGYNDIAGCYYFMTNESQQIYVGNPSVCESFVNLPAYYLKEDVSENSVEE